MKAWHLPSWQRRAMTWLKWAWMPPPQASHWHPVWWDTSGRTELKRGIETKRKDICRKRLSVYIVSRWWEERRRVGRKKTERRSNAEEEWERTGQEERVNLRTAVQTITHFWLSFDQERWVKMNGMTEMQSEWLIKDLVTITCCNMKLAAVALWTQWTQCTHGRGKKTRFACYMLVWLYLQAPPLINEHLASSSLYMTLCRICPVCQKSVMCLVFLVSR